MELSVSILRVDQVTQAYVDWFQNAELVRFSDNQYRTFSIEKQRAYVASCLMDPDIDLYGVFDRGVHIGNVTISGLTAEHKAAEISYLVGEPRYWGKGVATFAVANMIAFGKKKYGLNKLYAGVAIANLGSKRVLEKNSFLLEGVRRQHLLYGGKYYDQLDYGFLYHPTGEID
jgi:RimJ/RimL family protein N-acetyltransferase